MLFFTVLMSLFAWKPTVPWIIVIAILGIVYGVVMKEAVADDTMTPMMLQDLYPRMANETQLADFSYWSPK